MCIKLIVWFFVYKFHPSYTCLNSQNQGILTLYQKWCSISFECNCRTYLPSSQICCFFVWRGSWRQGATFDQGVGKQGLAQADKIEIAMPSLGHWGIFLLTYAHVHYFAPKCNFEVSFLSFLILPLLHGAMKSKYSADTTAHDSKVIFIISLFLSMPSILHSLMLVFRSISWSNNFASNWNGRLAKQSRSKWSRLRQKYWWQKRLRQKYLIREFFCGNPKFEVIFKKVASIGAVKICLDFEIVFSVVYFGIIFTFFSMGSNFLDVLSWIINRCM